MFEKCTKPHIKNLSLFYNSEFICSFIKVKNE